MRKYGLTLMVLILFATSLALIRLTAGSQLPDPNDPRQASLMTPDVLETNLKAASNVINERVARREITDDVGQKMLSEYANTLVNSIDLSAVAPRDAHQYGNIFRTARRWDLAYAAFSMAVKEPGNEDRRVNDTLRLAQTMAHLGRVEEAINLARTVFDAKPTGTAPILPSVLLEIAPAAKGKGHDGELAKLLIEAAEIHALTLVSKKTQEGLAFIYAQPFHIRNAFKLAASLFRSVGDEASAVATESRLPHLLEEVKQRR